MIVLVCGCVWVFLLVCMCTCVHMYACVFSCMFVHVCRGGGCVRACVHALIILSQEIVKYCMFNCRV